MPLIVTYLSHKLKMRVFRLNQGFYHGKKNDEVHVLERSVCIRDKSQSEFEAQAGALHYA